MKLVHNYLQNRKQRTKNGTAYNLWEEIFSGVPQGSILVPLLLNIFLEISKYEVEDDLHLNTNSHPTLKAVFKYKNHPIIISIRRFRHQVSNFDFSCIGRNTVLKETRSLSTTEASQSTVLLPSIPQKKKEQRMVLPIAYGKKFSQ